MQPKWFLSVTALVESGTGLFLLILPAIPLKLLLSVTPTVPETSVISRIAGAALLAIGAVCLLARSDQNTTTQRAVLVGVLIYDVAAAGLLAHAGAVLNMSGIALWPAVALHLLLTGWCVTCLWESKRTEM